MNESNPVAAGLAEGLRPRGVEVDTLTIDTEMLAAEERIRIVRAVERQAELSQSILAAQSRQADALETIAALLASCIGRGHSSCAPDSLPGSWAVSDVHYLRTGDGNKAFACERPSESDDD